MDDNPWGVGPVTNVSQLEQNRSASPSASSIHLDLSEEAPPAWDATNASPKLEVEGEEASYSHASLISPEAILSKTLGTTGKSRMEENVTPLAGLDTATFVPDHTSSSAKKLTTLPPLDDGPPMDDFPEDEITEHTIDGDASVPTPNDFGDDFEDFGEVGEGGDDDFGDFGGFDEEPSEGPGEPYLNTVHPSKEAVEPNTQSAASISSSAGPKPLRLDLSSPVRAAMQPQLQPLLYELFPQPENVIDDPERQVEGVAQVLVSESSRTLLNTLSSIPPLRPLDWKRSRIRREHLVAMGVPVNLDESLDPKPLASLIIPSQIAPGRAGSPSRSFSAPPLASPRPYSPAPISARSGTPLGRASAPVVPKLDKKRAGELCAITAEDLSLKSLSNLQAIKDEINTLSLEASEVLTYALQMREREVGDGETYNGMIQDLVLAAAKVKTTSKNSSSKASSGRWGRNTVR